MKKLFFAALLLCSASFTASAQLISFGIKAGPNFASLNGADGIDYKSRTSFHAGVIVEIRTPGNFAIQPELLYSSQGAKVEGMGDFNLDYVSVPIMVKYYILPDLLSLEAGPQFSFLVNEREEVFQQATTSQENNSFDFALAGGVGLDITKSFFTQARYTIGINDTSDFSHAQNAVFQLSVGYKF
ncbi:MAG TPA: porin family protein [Flavobacterium sp.]|jgi:hypothetical protein|nr:porin family protein [Flavobacterium sp.]